jgi:hypothetical protein
MVITNGGRMNEILLFNGGSSYSYGDASVEDFFIGKPWLRICPIFSCLVTHMPYLKIYSVINSNVLNYLN